MEFNPNSIDAQIASLRTLIEESEKNKQQRFDRQDELMQKLFTVADTTRVQIVQNIERLETHGRDLIEIKTQTQKTNGRVTALEHKDLKRAGWYAGASFIVAAIFQFAIHFLKV
jgi:hypothetical protein